MKKRLIAEWEEQKMVQLTWPHEGTDWAPILGEVEECYVLMAREIAKREKLLIVAQDVEKVKRLLEGKVDFDNLIFSEIETNDTWARDHGGLSVEEEGRVKILDYCFNGWGMKFAADKDNLITEKLYNSGVFGNAEYENCRDFVFEGGSIESDGKGTLMTTSQCLLSPNRNATYGRQQIEERLKWDFGAERVLWVDYGALAGDDTDSHIDTLARLAPNDTIVYQGCRDENDQHFEELRLMRGQLAGFETLDGKKYRLVELPMPEARYDGEERLPATYANYLVINGAVLVPTYGCDADEEAVRVIGEVFEGREIVGIDARVLIRQHGSVHCCTMQY